MFRFLVEKDIVRRYDPFLSAIFLMGEGERLFAESKMR